MISFFKKIIRKKIYFSGPFENWEIAERNSTGYDSEEIFQKVKKSALFIKKNKKGYERDSVISYESDYDQYILKIFDLYSDQINKKINILDFGGSIGSLYFKYKKKLKNKFLWSIIEQKKFVDEGKKNFQNEELNFFYNIDDYLNLHNPDIVLASSSLQYLKNYKEVLKKIIESNAKFIIILKTPFSKKNNDEIYIQKPLKHIYNSTYPCWIFSQINFVSNFLDKYDLDEKKITKPEFFQISFFNLYFKNKKLKYEKFN